METSMVYILKVNIALIIFYLLYIAFLKKDTFFASRRYFLLAAIAFSFVYPFVSVSAWGNIISLDKPVQYAAHVTVGEPVSEAFVSEIVLAPAKKAPIQINWRQVLFYTLSAGIAIFMSRFLWQLTSILLIKRKSVRRNVDGIRVFDLQREITPFSFFRWIFIHINSHSDAELKQILLHEQTHARQWHSVDVLLMEIIGIFFWWNPAVWLLKREVAVNLEYLADNSVLRTGINSREYQYHLLRLTYHQNAAQLVNNFNVSLLKQRITMMNKTKSPVQRLAKYLIALPLALLLVAGNSIYAQDQKGDEIFTAEVEKFPEFPGGNSAFMKFLAEGIKYPVIAQENNDQGRVLANFVVEKDGRISNIRIISGATTLLDAEVVRLLKSMPNWEPGEKNNKPVRVRFTLPAVFRLQGDNVGTGKSPATPTSPFANEKGKMLDELVVVGYVRETTQVPPPPPLPGRDNTESNGDEVFIVVQNAPQYPGGNEALNQFISANLRYPKIAMENGIQGRVIANFVVEKDGSLSDIQVVRGVDPSLDKEAVRIIGSMPKWIPGEQRGNKVRVRYLLPINFRVSDGKSTVEIDKSTQEKQEKLNSALQKIAGDEVFVVVDDNPEFPGGTSAMLSYLSENIRYPKIAHENGIQGRVICNFVVMKDGSIADVRVVRGVDPSLDAEAVRVLETMPAWKPGKQRGQPVNVRFTLPVVFSLTKKEPNQQAVEKLKSNGTVSVVKVKAEGPQADYFKFLAQSVTYPVIAQENGIMGLVKGKYSVNEKGVVSNAKITEGVDPSLDKEALRVMNSIPPTIALLKTGGKAAAQVDFSVYFRLRDENSAPAPRVESDVVVVGYGKSK